jgi:hypothetical protein
MIKNQEYAKQVFLISNIFKQHINLYLFLYSLSIQQYLNNFIYFFLTN